MSLPKLKKAYEKGTRGISWGPLLTPGPRAVPKFPNGQSAPGTIVCRRICFLSVYHLRPVTSQGIWKGLQAV
ncbi:unnamed protein product [Staurois parvus]|uniref:Uncharacterized protein n=1 Tax=Staurois parvus TaxID=386267 RepID=A0ABN9B3E4_9NEOB|nr:unnamed protein product [Staurois parvus]